MNNFLETLQEISENNVLIAENQQKVFDAGEKKGFEAGQTSEYDRFWNSALKPNGKTREYFAYAFGSIFNDNNFNPPSTIIPKSQKACEICKHNNNGTCDIYGALPTEKKEAVAQGMFQGSQIKRTLNDSDVDWQCVPQMNHAFSSSSFIDVANINAKNCTSMKEAFWWCNTLRAVSFTGFGKVVNWSKAFYRCSNLDYVYFGGGDRIISSINFGDCNKLTLQSIKYILRALSKDVSDCTITFSLAAVNKAYESAEGANDGSTTYYWLFCTSEVSNWKVALI